MEFFVFCLFAGFIVVWAYARGIEKRRREDAKRHNETAAALTARIHTLEQQAKIPWAPHPEEAKPHAPPAAAPVKPTVALPAAPPRPVAAIPAAAPTPVLKAPSTGGIPVTRVLAREGLHPPAASTASTAHVPPAKPEPKPAIPVAPAPPLPPPTITPSAPPAAAHAAQASPAASAVSASLPKPAATPATHAAPAAASHSAPPTTMPAMVKPAAPQPLAQRTIPLGPPSPPKPKRSWFSIEEALGRNWLPKIGITLVVLGVAFIMGHFWGGMPAAGRVAILYVSGLGLLIGGIFMERKERYQILGRTLIAGGWAVIFVMSYAIRHVNAIQLLNSDAADLSLLLAVASVMVWHTLKYNSQVVTGLAFLLGFVSVTLNPDPPYNLIAGIVLITGLTVIVLRRQWFELEVCAILASYANHFYWLYPIINPMAEKGPFPAYKGSLALMISYWAVFRASYLLRKISGPRQEFISTIAGLLNPVLFLAVMKYQSFHPEWAFYALLVMGAVEFILGQLAVSRARKAPFQILSSLGATLMVMSVPFKYAGSHSLEILWMAGAEAFLLAGIFTRERLFRQFGGIISLLAAVYLAGWPPNGVIFHAAHVINGQPHHDVTLGLVFAMVAALFYCNNHVIGRVWQRLFDREVEQQAFSVFSFAASLFAAGAIYAIVAGNAVAVALAALVTALAWTGKQFSIAEMVYQAHWIVVVTLMDVSITAIHLDATWHSIPERLIAFGVVAGLVYLSSNFVRSGSSPVVVSLNIQAQTAREEDVESGRGQVAVVLYRWAATGLIALAMWMQVWFAPGHRQWLIAMLWTGLALVLSGVAEWRKRAEFKWQAFTLAMISFLCALLVNFDFDQQFHHLSYRLISVTLVAGGIYLLTRWSPSSWLRPAYSWAGTILLGYLAFKETQAYQPWTPVVWIGMAAVLALAARFWKDRALLWQTHLLSAAAGGWTLAITLQQYHDTHEHLMTMLITVLITSVVLYALAWLTRITEFVESRVSKAAYTWVGTILLGCLVYWQTQERYELWTSVLWIALATALALAARLWNERSLLWQTHLLALLATGWTVAIAFLGRPEYHGTRTQWITVLTTAALLYALTWITNISRVIEDPRIWQAYSWAGSLLVTWLAWYQLDPIGVSLAWGLFALVLFELGYKTQPAYLRAQAYIALTCSFAHLFYANFNTPLPGGALDPHIVLIVLPVAIYFWVYWRLHEKTDSSARLESKLRIAYLLACMGTATVAALARFELPAEMVVAGYATLVPVLLVTVWWSKLQVFLHQALIMLGVTVFRLAMHNFHNLSSSFISALPGSLWAIGLVAVSIPLAFRLRAKEKDGNWLMFLVHRPEQPLFFAAVILMAVLLAIRWPDTLTLEWGIEGIVIFPLALMAKERSFRLTGLALVMLCIAKIAFWDAWRMSNFLARALTFIGVGVVIMVVSYLYARNREALREYL